MPSSKPFIQTWMKMQALLGKLGRESVKNRIGKFKPSDLIAENGSLAEKELSQLSIGTVLISLAYFRG